MRTAPSLVCSCCLLAGAHAADQPQWGHAWSRNQVSPETNLPAVFDPAAGKNIKWTARLGTETHSSPVIAGGRIYIGTNNGRPRDPRHEGDRGVLMCFDEATGAFLWQLLVPKRSEDIYLDWPNSGISSPATVVGDRVYIVSNRGEVLCLDAHGMTNGNDGPFRDEAVHNVPKGRDPIPTGPAEADILWLFDLTSGAGIWSHDAAHSSILVHGDHLYLNTGTGVDNTHRKIRTPDAPSLVVLDRHTGRFLARDRENIAPLIFHSTWSSPSMAEVNGKPRLFFAGGNGVIYGFDPITEAKEGSVQTLRKVWEFDFDPAGPKTNVHQFVSNRRESPSNIYGMPVFHDGKLYVAGGGDIWWGKRECSLKCLDATGPGNTTSRGALWSYPLNQHVLGTVAIANGLVFLADIGRKMHCLDARTGAPRWTHEIEGDAWASPFVADGKVYLGTRTGNVYVFRAEAEKTLLHTWKFDKPISATAAAANGVLYLATMTHLYAVAAEKTDRGEKME